MDGIHEDAINFISKLSTMDIDTWWKYVTSNESYKNHQSIIFNKISYHAILSGRRDLLQLMINNGFNVNSEDSFGIKPIFMTIQRISVSGISLLGVMKDLISYGAFINCEDKSSGLTPLMWSMNEDALAHFVILLNSGADVFYESKIMKINSIEYAIKKRYYSKISIMREFI